MTADRFFIPDHIDINGGKQLKELGLLTISGAKNEVLGSMAACLLTDQPLILKNVPYIQDVLNMGNILLDLGVDVKHNPAKKMMRLHAKKITSNTLSEEATLFRASYYLWGSLLARFNMTKEFNSVEALIPGGCNFGNRGNDFHYNLLETVFDADIELGDTKCKFKLPKQQKKTDSLYTTRVPSHGATFHYALSTAVSNNNNYMYNSALEPEVAGLIQLLNDMGAKDVRGQNATAIISGKHKGLLKGCEYSIKPDRMETGFYALLAMITNSKIKLKGVDRNSCTPWLNLAIELTGIKPTGHPNMNFDFTNLDWENVLGKTIIVSPFPGKETDMEQLWLPVLGKASTQSTIIDSIWPGRLGTPEQAKEIRKLGLNMKYITDYADGKALKIDIKPSVFKPAPKGITAANLRGAAGYILGAAAAPGKTRIYQPGFATRGHPNLIKNLKELGVDVKESEEGTCLESLPYWDLSSQRQR